MPAGEKNAIILREIDAAWNKGSIDIIDGRLSSNFASPALAFLSLRAE